VGKSASVDELITAAKFVRNGDGYVECEIASDIVLTRYFSNDPLQQLTTREIELIRLLVGGFNAPLLVCTVRSDPD
jgi:two-component system, NarL family, invasion response regulator UvrY